MKRVIGVITFEAYVPEDMDVNDVREMFIERAEQLDGLRVHLQDYHDQEEAEPLFEYQSATVGESLTLAVG